MKMQQHPNPITPAEEPPLRFEINFLESHDQASIVGELQRIARFLGKPTVTAKEIDKFGRLNSRTVMERFGTLRKAHEAAGLIASRYTKATEAELIKVVADLWTITLRESGRRPRCSEVKKYGFPVSARTIVERFGTWKKALIATARSLPGSPEPAEAEKPVQKRQAIPIRKRYLVFKRDAFKCRLCGRAGGELEVDHIVPVHHGGSDLLHNLQTLCKACNRGKGSSLQ